MPQPLHILWQDDHLVALYKPAGWLVHRTGLDAGETRFVMQTLRDQLGRHVFPVHRLDKGTCGVLVMALHSDAAGRFPIFENQATHKVYIAMVRGWAPGCEGRPPLRPDDAPPDARAKRPHPVSHAGAVDAARSQRPALCHHPRVAGGGVPPPGGATRYAATSSTWRTPSLAMPPTAGPAEPLVGQRLGQQRLWLHALRLSLPHPLTGEMLHLHSGLPLQPAPGSNVAACPMKEVPEAPSLDWQRLQADWPWQWLKTPRPHPRARDGNPEVWRRGRATMRLRF